MGSEEWLGPLSLRAEFANGYRVLRLRGELDASNAERFRRVVLEQAARGRRELVLDLSELRFVDASGLRAIRSAWATTLGRLTIIGVTTRVTRVAEAAGWAREEPFA
jgi:anti-anti-sigma factor